MKIHLSGIGVTRDIYLNGKRIRPDYSQKIRNHSPDGFNWGYGGSGPAQAALGILLAVTNKETALKNYQNFKWEIISQIPQKMDFDMEINMQKYLT
jgi:Family of unknown function (DUF6166)